jgi:FkbM family methyltransferase
MGEIDKLFKLRRILEAVQWHSQPATHQDQWVVNTLKGMCGGFFVECGGFDGITASNTLALERYFDWRGLIIEADPELSKLCKRNRPPCWHINKAVSNIDTFGDIYCKFFRGGQFSGLTAFLPPAWREEHERRHNEEIWVEGQTLNTMLKDCPEIIDYFSLDVEGAEVSVLEEYFKNPQHQFRCMTVEFLQDAGTLMRLQRLMEPHGYELAQCVAWDAFFINKTLGDLP